MIRTALVIAATMALCRGAVHADGPAEPARAHMYAAVYLVRGSVVGSHAGVFGPHIRTGDTTWRRSSRSNLITFGFGSWVQGNVRRLYVAAGDGLHRSTDDGATWKIITGWRTMEITSVLPDPDDARHIMVTSPGGVYRTTDDGATWQERMKGMRTWYVRSLAYDLRTRSVIHAVAQDDIYSTSDRGGTWRPMRAGKGLVTSFLQPRGDGWTYLAGFEDQGIRISTDGGKSWRNAATPSQASIYAMASSADGRTVFAAGWQTGVWRSTDGGRHWSELWRDNAINAVFCLMVDRDQPDHVFAGTDGNGVYESLDGGKHWSFAGLAGGKIKQLYIYP
jgi:photosystem II stability/assembly factor-like uncharacterized protein